MLKKISLIAVCLAMTAISAGCPFHDDDDDMDRYVSEEMLKLLNTDKKVQEGS
ncbi:MAG: hypothetical protein LBL35_00335 [Clostridiales bacterium]|jgi:hypothetical protein|nr:hypothetical protein [Clostridiales bacterium]